MNWWKTWEKTQVTNTRNVKGGVYTVLTDIKLLIGENYEQF